MKLKYSRTILVCFFGLITALAGIIVLLGWLLNIDALKTFGLGGVTMKANTALSFLFSGLALIFLQQYDRKINVILARLFSVIVTLLGTLVLSQYVFSINIGIDELLFNDVKDAVGKAYPGRMMLNTALNFTLLGIVLFALSYKKMERNFLILFIYLIASSISILALFGYTFKITELTGITHYATMPINTAATFIILCIGIYFTMYNKKRNTITLEYRLFSGITVAAVLIIFGSEISVTSIKSQEKAADWVEHTQNVKVELNHLKAEIEQLLADTRGFLISADKQFLERRKSLEEDILKTLYRLKTLTIDNTKQQERLITLNKLAKERIEFSELLINTRLIKGEEAAEALFTTLRGKRVTDDIIDLISTMIVEENRLLYERNLEEREKAHNSLTIIYIGLLIQLILLILIFIIVKKDVVGRRKAESDLQKLNEELEDRVVERTNLLIESENRSINIIESTHDGLLIVNAKGTIVYANPAAENIFGRSIQELIGFPFSLPVDSDKNNDISIITKKGELKNIEFKSSKINWEGQVCWLITMNDITERKITEEKIKKANRVYTMLSNINQMIVRIKDKQTIFNEACRIAVDDGEFKMAWIGILDERLNKINPVASAGYTTDYLHKINIDLNDEERSKGPTGRVVKSGVHYIANDIANNPEMIPWREDALKLNYRSSASFPIIVFGKTIGTINFYSEEIQFFDEEEINLLDELTMDISYAVEFIETEANRKEAENQAIEYNKRFNNLVTSLKDVVWSASIDGSKIIDVSDAFEDLYGISVTKFKENPKLWVEMVHPDDRNIAEKSGKELFEKGTTQAEYRIVKPDGTITWLLDRKALTYDESGKPIQMGGIAKDITERKLTEDKLRESEQYFRDFVVKLPASVYSFSTKRGGIYYSQVTEDILGYSIKHLLSNPFLWNSSIHPNDKKTVDHVLENINNNENFEIEYRIKNKEGKWRWIYDRSFSIKTLTDEIIIDGVAFDITERKLAEEKIKLSEEQLRITINAGNVGLWDWDLTTNEVYFSPEWKKQIGYDDDELKNNYDAWESKLHPDDLEPTLANLKTTLTPPYPPYHFEFRLRHKDGSYRWIMAQGTIHLDENNKPVRMLGSHIDISEQKKAQEALHESEVYLKTIIESEPECVKIIDKNGKLLEMNSAGLAMLEATSLKEIQQYDLMDFILPKHRKPFLELHKRVMEGKKDTLEFKIKGLKGSVRWFETHAAPLRDSDGKVIKLLGVTRDITERKQMEELVKESEQKYRIITDSTLDVIFMIDKTGKLLYCNETVEKVLGYKPDELVGKSFTSFVPVKSLPQYLTQLKNVFLDKEVRNFITQVYHKKGHLLDVEINGKLVHSNNNTVGLGTIRDITERIRAEKELKRNNETMMKLLNISKILSSNLDMANVLQSTTDSAAKLVNLKSAATYLFSGETLKLWATTPTLPSNVPEELCNVLLSEHPYIKKTISTKRPVLLPDTSTANLTPAERAVCDIRGLRTVLYLPLLVAEKVLGVLIVASVDEPRLISEAEIDLCQTLANLAALAVENARLFESIQHHSLELEQRVSERTTELEKARNEAESANQAKSEFLSRMSHELRTPMNSILGFAQLMNMQELTPAHKKGVDHILKSGKHLLGLINEVLDLSRIEAGKLSISLEPTSLSEIISESLDIVNPLAIEQNISLESINLSDEDLSVYADKQKLKQVLLNLINNAVKYNHEGGSVRVEYGKHFTDEQKTVRISVIDNGKGIAPNELHKLFNPFQRIGTEISEIEGTGLGLAIAKKIIEVMHGNIGVESKVGIGSTFWIELPQLENQLDYHEKVSKEVQLNKDNISILGKLLYIEDNVSNIQLVKQIIEFHRPTVHLITEMYGKRTVEVASDYQPDLILLDLDLPDIHGSEVLSLLQKNNKTKSIPVVILSANVMISQIEKLIKAGAKNYLTKPLDVVEFLKVVDDVLKQNNKR